MKTYQSEEEFVKNFAKDIKEESEFCVNGKQFTATAGGVNKSKQRTYDVTIDGEKKVYNITQLKAKLGVTWTMDKANNASGNADKVVTKFIDKTDKEIAETAEVEAKRVDALISRIYAISDRWGVDIDSLLDVDREKALKEAMLKRRDAAVAERAKKAKEAAEAEAVKRATVDALGTQLAAALAKGDLSAVARISAEMAKAAK